MTAIIRNAATTDALLALADRCEQATEWRAVPGWPYEASDGGVLRNAVTKKELRPTVSGKGYARVTFQANLLRRDVRVHRAIYEAWFGPIPTGLTVNHLNGDKLDNRPTNLEICTAAENTRHAARMGLMATGRRNGAWTQPEKRRRGSAQGNTPLTESAIPIIRKLANAGHRHGEIAERYGVSRSAIGLIVNGKTWTHV